MKHTLHIVFLLLLAGCSNSNKKLPVLGEPSIMGNDTIYPTIPAFSFISQDSLIITEKTFDNKIYVADFIFLSCPTICPKMTSELKTVYEIYKSNPDILFISHTIDPERDTPERLYDYTNALKIDSKKWFFVTGNKDNIYAVAENYFATAYSDSTAPGGFVHSGGLLLIDKDKHIRGVYDGTDHSAVKKLIKDIPILLNEYE
jgi:protein SCO1/2